MKMRCVTILAIAAMAAAPLGAVAQTPTPAMRATLEARQAGRVSGTVTVSPHGNASMVHIELAGPGSAAKVITLKSGSDCNRSAPNPATSVALNHITGGSSNTLVEIPFSSFRSRHFVVDVRDATARAQLAEACAKL